MTTQNTQMSNEIPTQMSTEVSNIIQLPTPESPSVLAFEQCPHTIKSMSNGVQRDVKTIRRWVGKANVQGHTFDGKNTLRFTDDERESILAYNKVRPSEDEVIEPELMPEPGAITLSTTSEQATGLIRFDIEPIELAAPTADLQALQAQTQQLERVAQDGANALAAYFGARLDVGIANIAAKQDNLLQGIEARALNVAARSAANTNQGPNATPGKA